jgi:hypothetical protein
MKFEIRRVGSPPGCPIEGAYPGRPRNAGEEWFIDITTLEELLSLCDNAKDDLVVNRNLIVIYDDYME